MIGARTNPRRGLFMVRGLIREIRYMFGKASVSAKYLQCGRTFCVVAICVSFTNLMNIYNQVWSDYAHARSTFTRRFFLLAYERILTNAWDLGYAVNNVPRNNRRNVLKFDYPSMQLEFFDARLKIASQYA